MTTENKCFEDYPGCIVFASNLVSIGIYAIGAYIIYQLGLIWLLLYLLFILFLEFRVMKKSCTNCYYYGKKCAFGKGRLSALFFRKGDPKKFSERQITWKDLIPDLIVSLIPFLVGIALLALDFDLLLLVLVILLALLSSVGNGFVRGTLACRYCKQRELGCPAERLFNKRK